jgi:hypothetical protein
MNFQSGGAFRRAVEERLNTKAKATGLPLVRLRKMVVFDRFLARLVTAQPDAWALKGGLALQLRLGGRSRTTKDIDLLSFSMADQVLSLLREAASLDLKDWFTFEVSEPERVPPTDQAGRRYSIRSMLDGRTFEDFHVDVGIGDAVVESLEYLNITDLLSFAGISPTSVPCYPVTQQIAEKLHAYTKPRKSGESSRVKDLMDLLLLSQLQTVSGARLQQAIQATFTTEGTHSVPETVPPPPGKWAVDFRKMASDVGLSITFLDEAYILVRGFLDPVLSEEPPGEWDPVRKLWC